MALDSPKLRKLEERMKKAQAQSSAYHERAKRGLDKIKQTVSINAEDEDKIEDESKPKAIKPTVWLDKTKLDHDLSAEQKDEQS